MQLEQSITDFFKSDYDHIAAVYLFGSSVSENTGKGSDVDIGLLFDSDAMGLAPASMDDILVRLPRVLRRDVHPVVMNTAGEELLRQIFSKGKCLIVKDDKALAYFKMTAFARIANYSYYRQTFQEGVIKSVTGEMTGG